ncbi:FecCD family ABC transporter permease [Prauserella cavernicola]|uniref:Iron chelate uptake ABC transporter family permease subunit n=1 Tax=Prauserella cavernicola TaxID=2800127 RepID=A0A934V1Q6_9PSEU|nr:iron chelate uptake ABC transporter family permease subunit [Prauserella cavernicola]MBK1783701.1 iron chelate uptake ABC transporter family permease subunit [Prauserella cavernicola]
MSTTVRGPRSRVVPGRPVRLWGGRVSVRVQRRPVLVTIALALGLAVVFVVSLMVGDYPIAADRVLLALAGDGERLDRFFVLDVRLPRLLLAMTIGAALALAGAIFQRLSGNALGSPDIVGFNDGAATGALLVSLALSGAAVSAPLGAVLGGLVAAVLIYTLSYRGGVHGLRLILVGIGVSAMLASVRAYLISRSDLTVAQGALAWLIGNLNGLGWSQAQPVIIGVVSSMLVLALLSRRLGLLEMGDDRVAALGVPVQRTQVLLLLIAVSLTAFAVAYSGPIQFIALAAPQLARRLARTAGSALVTTALLGALLLASADLVAQRLFAPMQIPVGAATLVIGGAYLVWLLRGEQRAGRV